MPPYQRASPSSELGEETPRHHLPATQGSGHELAHGEPAQMHRSGGGADEAHAFTPLNSREEHPCVDTQSVIRSAGPILPPRPCYSAVHLPFKNPTNKGGKSKTKLTKGGKRQHTANGSFWNMTYTHICSSSNSGCPPVICEGNLDVAEMSHWHLNLYVQVPALMSLPTTFCVSIHAGSRLLLVRLRPVPAGWRGSGVSGEFLQPSCSVPSSVHHQPRAGGPHSSVPS